MNPQKSPKPPLSLSLCALLMIAGAALVAAGLFSTLFSSDEIGILLSVLFLPFPVVFIFFQYRGIFHKHPGAAGLAGVMLLTCGLMLCTIIPIVILASMGFGSWSIAWMVSIFGSPLLLASFFLSAHLNFNWAESLRLFYVENNKSSPKMHFSLRELFGATTLVSVIAWLGITFSR